MYNSVIIPKPGKTMKQFVSSIRRSLRKQTLLEWVVIVAILAVLVALLTPETKWASSGDLRLPVKVFVFDANQYKPIPDAKVTVFRAFPVGDQASLVRWQDQFKIGPISELPHQFWTTTDAQGIAVIDYEFRTGASHKRPVTHAHVNFTWVRVEADGFGGAAIPVRHDSQPSSALKQKGEVLVQVGLIPMKD